MKMTYDAKGGCRAARIFAGAMAGLFCLAAAGQNLLMNPSAEPAI